MLKLTLVHDNEQFLYVSAAALVSGAIWVIPYVGTGIWIGREFLVTETPDQIMAMTEMQKVMSPLYYLPGTNIVAADQDDAKARGWPYYQSQNPNRSLPPSGTNHKSTTSWEYSHPFTTEVKGVCS